MGVALMYEYRAKFLGMNNSGYVRLNIDLGFHRQEVTKLPLHGILISDVDEAKAWLSRDLPANSDVILTSHQVGSVFTATLYVEGQSMNINDMLVSDGIAVDMDPTQAGKAGK